MKYQTLKGCRVVGRKIHRHRWRIKLKDKDGKIFNMPQAHFVWLKGNPFFEEIPPGYVIHHLDHDPLNDDISNLALMEKHQHSSHHWKSKNFITPLEIVSTDETIEEIIPTKKPRIYNCDKNRWYVEFCFRPSKDSNVVSKKVRRLNGNIMKTKDDAETFIKQTWGHIKWDNENRPIL